MITSRVKSMVEERQWSMNEGNVRILRDIDELKVSCMSFLLNTLLNKKPINRQTATETYLLKILIS